MLIGSRSGEEYAIKDDKKVLNFFAANSKSKSTREFVTAFASNTDFWGEDLTKYNRFIDMVCVYLEEIKKDGMTATVETLIKE